MGKKNRDQRGHCLPTLLLEVQTRLEARTTDPQLRPAGQKLHPPPTLGIPDMASRTGHTSRGRRSFVLHSFQRITEFSSKQPGSFGDLRYTGEEMGVLVLE